ncbi:hypothetical protein HHK36_024404 [Tetracentron sinense]|uniref:Uncharacterized protein n=1 Tax=Tetracentron sinense TaxID=13715 RepID=A0A834YQL3_TETSI|nr:hypothetical protein HHK36_024404 [Tetracentron sinense]
MSKCIISYMQWLKLELICMSLVAGQSLGLPFIPPYLGLSEDERRKTITGLNYATGSAGILTETGTGTASRMNLGMEKQVQLFEETVRTYLPGNFKSQKKLCRYFIEVHFYGFDRQQ